MAWNRRQFLKTAATGAVLLPLAGRSFASRVLTPADDADNDPGAGLLDDLQRAAFEFFWNEADPHTGLVRDRASADGGDRRLGSSIAATGFGLTALCIGHQRGYGSRPEIMARVRRNLHFLAHQAPTERGFLYHFVEMNSGKRSVGSEISPMDMAILLCGALTCREYFHDAQIRHDATLLYHRVDWPWALNKGETFALDWTPEFGFSPLRWDAYCESMMLYLLALGSPTHPISPQCWHSIRRPEIVYGDYRFISAPAPLFVHQFSHAWFDFRNKRDQYANYFDNSVIACRAHRQFCASLSTDFPCYSEDVWGITASDSSAGYVAWGGPPMLGPIDGTIVPAASAGSLPFLFNESLVVLRNLRGYYGRQIWKRYGFVDAFNPLTGWTSSDVLGIDVGISMLMAENARSQMVWNTFMRNREVGVALEKAGFRSLYGPFPAYADQSPQLPSRG
ncbi:MAG: glucoamylase family protein [Terriglobales bacterium]